MQNISFSQIKSLKFSHMNIDPRLNKPNNNFSSLLENNSNQTNKAIINSNDNIAVLKQKNNNYKFKEVDIISKKIHVLNSVKSSLLKKVHLSRFSNKNVKSNFLEDLAHSCLNSNSQSPDARIKNKENFNNEIINSKEIIDTDKKFLTLYKSNEQLLSKSTINKPLKKYTILNTEVNLVNYLPLETNINNLKYKIRQKPNKSYEKTLMNIRAKYIFLGHKKDNLKIKNYKGKLEENRLDTLGKENLIINRDIKKLKSLHEISRFEMMI